MSAATHATAGQAKELGHPVPLSPATMPLMLIVPSTVAVDTLSDPTSRQLYNQYGPEGMKQHQGSQAGQGNACSAWDEFQPFKKENKRTRARAASQASASAGGDVDGATSSGEG